MKNDLSCIHDYPEEIQNLIFEITEKICKYFPKSLVILTGSAARGEISYIVENGFIKLLSDLEFFILLEKYSISDRFLLAKLRTVLDRFAKSSPFYTRLFHIDVSIGSLRAFQHTKTLLKYETLKNGIVVHDPNEFKSSLNIAEHENEEFSIIDINNILLYRHFALVNNLIFDSNSENKIKTIINRYVVCRNSLDLLTTLFYHDKLYISSYKSRNTLLLKMNESELSHLLGIDDNNIILEFKHFMAFCYNCKIHPNSPIEDNVFQLLEKYLMFSEIVLLHLIGKEAKYGNIQIKDLLINKSGKVFKPVLNPLKRKIWITYLFLTGKLTFNFRYLRTPCLEKLYLNLNEYLTDLVLYETSGKVNHVKLRKERKKILNEFAISFPFAKKVFDNL